MYEPMPPRCQICGTSWTSWEDAELVPVGWGYPGYACPPCAEPYRADSAEADSAADAAE